jgi:hypothetical protein
MCVCMAISSVLSRKMCTIVVFFSLLLWWLIFPLCYVFCRYERTRTRTIGVIALGILFVGFLLATILSVLLHRR